MSVIYQHVETGEHLEFDDRNPRLDGSPDWKVFGERGTQAPAPSVTEAPAADDPDAAPASEPERPSEPVATAGQTVRGGRRARKGA